MNTEAFIIVVLFFSSLIAVFIYRTVSQIKRDSKTIENKADDTIRGLKREAEVDIQNLTIDERIQYTNYIYGRGPRPDFLKEK